MSSSNVDDLVREQLVSVLGGMFKDSILVTDQGIIVSLAGVAVLVRVDLATVEAKQVYR